MMRRPAWIALCCLGLLAGCATEAMHRAGLDLVRAGKVEEGVRLLRQATQEEPGNVRYRQDYLLAQSSASSGLLAQAGRQRAQGDAAGATATLQRLLELDPASPAARDALLAAQRAQLHEQQFNQAQQLAAAGTPGRARALLAAILAEEPGHGAARSLLAELEQEPLHAQLQDAAMRDHRAAVNLEFRDASVRMVLEALSRTTGINFIFDKDIGPDVRTTVFLREAKVDEALDLILRNSQLRYKVLNSNTVQVYPDTPDKRRDYQELVVRAFYLQDASAAQIQTVLKTLLRMKDIVIDERLNLVTVRDTPEAVRLAERLVALHDLAEPEVMLELEVLEVQRDDLLKLGFQWPNQVGLVPLARAGQMTLSELKGVDSSRLGLSFTNPALSLRQDHGVSNLLANPRMRVHNREKATILIGDKVPVITTTSNATGFVAESVQYLDVGLKLAAEPQIHPSNEVSLRLSLEVSSIAGQVSTPNGSVAYQVGTRNAATYLRLQDGETQVLAGLISDQDRHSASGVPGLSRLPLLGRLFSAPSDSRTKTEIVMSVTPRVVRGAGRTAQAREFWSGTEAALSTRPLRLAEPAQAKPARAAKVAAAGAGAAPPQAQAQAPELIWSGPNQVAPGEEFTLALRWKAGERDLPPLRVLYDAAALQVTAAAGGELAGTSASVTFDAARQLLEVAPPAAPAAPHAARDGTLLSLTLKAAGAAGPTALRIVSAAAPGTEWAIPYTVTVAQ